MQGKWVVEIGWQMHRIEVTGDIAQVGQGPPRAVETMMMMMMILSILTLMALDG